MESIHIILDDSLNERSKLCLNNNFFDTKIKFNRKTKRIQKLILILILLILKGINSSSKNYYKFNKLVTNETVKLINVNYTKREYKIMGIDYFNKLKRSKINNTRKKINNPKISVIIPIYNCEKTIELSLKSIHFQNTTTDIINC
jgi:hypothetical protein